MRLKHICTIISIIITTICSKEAAFAQYDITIPEVITAKNYRVNGPVEKIYIIYYEAGLQERMLVDSTIKTDTVLSRLKEENLYFNKDTQLTRVTIDSFDEKGKTELFKETRYYYNGDKQLASVTFLEDGKIKDSTSFEYDRHGELDKQIFYDRKDRIEKRIEYFYRHDRIFNVKVRDPERKLLQFVRFEYDNQGRLREQEIKGSTMQYISSVKFTYDTLNNGNYQEGVYDYVGAYKYKGMVANTYNKKMQVVERSTADSNKRITEYASLEYNNMGLKSKEVIFTKYKNDYTYFYEYDDNGNWKTMNKYESGKPVLKTHRVFEYYSKDEKE